MQRHYADRLYAHYPRMRYVIEFLDLHRPDTAHSRECRRKNKAQRPYYVGYGGTEDRYCNEC